MKFFNEDFKLFHLRFFQQSKELTISVNFAPDFMTTQSIINKKPLALTI